MEGSTINNWIELTHDEEKNVWSKILNDFQFSPSISKFPSFILPGAFITYNISTYLNWPGDLEEYEMIYKDLEEKSLFAFQELTDPDEYFYALDWQHPCYWVNPYLEFPRDDFNEWTIPIFPDGDYYFFIQKEFNWGFLGHPWEESITIFGSELIEVFEKNCPKMFNTVLRQG
ncbi:hypothetical protein J6TS2_11650 [Heyndrickxia sporothermodurans]|nr:hypothetical protein J6TS2_11650 [Heyndrickxia sporothermodurans]